MDAIERKTSQVEKARRPPNFCAWSIVADSIVVFGTVLPDSKSFNQITGRIRYHPIEVDQFCVRVSDYGPAGQGREVDCSATEEGFVIGTESLRESTDNLICQ